MKNMLNIINHQGDESLNHNEITLTPVRMAIIKKSKDGKYRWGCIKGDFCPLLMSMLPGIAIAEITLYYYSMQVTQKVKI
jgi:hypothetical protein